MFSLTKARLPTRWGLVAVILAIGIVGGFPATQGVSAATVSSTKLWDAVSQFNSGPATSEAQAVVLAAKSVTLDLSPGDSAVLSSTADGTGDILADNFISINGVNVCVGGDGTNCFLGGSGLTPISPIDVSSAIPIGNTTERLA